MTQNAIDPNSPIPRYYQLYTSLRSRIREREFQPGDALPSERQLVEIYGISRITVVKALDLLDQEGLIERQHGRGNFVTQPETKPETKQRTKIAFLVPHVLDSFITAVLNGVMSLAQQHQIYVQIVSAYGAENEEAIIEDLIANEVRGILTYPFTGFNNAAVYARLQERGFPLVMMDRYYPDLETDRVIYDDERAGYVLTKTLITQKHKRIVALPGHEVSVSSIHNRLRGYQRALEEAGLTYYEELVWLDIYKRLDLRPQADQRTRETYQKLLERIEHYEPTAFLALNHQVVEQIHADLMTINRHRVQKALRQDRAGINYDLGIKVAGVSFQRILHNDGSVVAMAIQNGQLLGERATDLLIQRMSGNTDTMPIKIFVPMQIQVSDEILGK